MDRPAFGSLRFASLLAAFFLMLSASVIVHLFDLGGAVSIVMGLGFVAMLVSAAYAVQARPVVVRACRILAALSVGLIAVDALVGNEHLRAAGYLVGLVFLTCVVTAIVRMLLTTKRVSGDTLYASICAYLLLGMIWTLAYSLAEYVQPGSFRLPAGEEMVFGGQDSSNVLYFSYVTLTTLGYGDVTPAQDAVRLLAIGEAMIGQIFLVVLVARLVGLNVGQAMGGSQSPD